MANDNAPWIWLVSHVQGALFCKRLDLKLTLDCGWVPPFRSSDQYRDTTKTDNQCNYWRWLGDSGWEWVIGGQVAADVLVVGPIACVYLHAIEVNR